MSRRNRRSSTPVTFTAPAIMSSRMWPLARNRSRYESYPRRIASQSTPVPYWLGDDSQVTTSVSRRSWSSTTLLSSKLIVIILILEYSWAFLDIESLDVSRLCLYFLHGTLRVALRTRLWQSWMFLVRQFQGKEGILMGSQIATLAMEKTVDEDLFRTASRAYPLFSFLRLEDFFTVCTVVKIFHTHLLSLVTRHMGTIPY